MVTFKQAGDKAHDLHAAGDLLAVEALDRTGLVVTSEGAFVRIFKVTPLNPLLMSPAEQEKVTDAFARLVSQLRGDEVLQFYITAKPVNLSELLAGCRAEVQASAGPAPTRESPARDELAHAQWLLYAAMEESLRLHADEQAATETTAYVVVPRVPRQSTARSALQWARRGKLPSSPLERPLAAHRRAAREHLAHVDSMRSELDGEGMATELLDGEQVLKLLWERFNPTKADRGVRVAARRREVLGELDAVTDRDAALEAATALRAQVAQSSLHFKASHQHVRVDQDVEQTIVVSNTVGRTHLGWLHGAMLTRQPYTLSVYVQGLERRRERRQLKIAYRRLFTINRGAEHKGRVPDFDRYIQEGEYQDLLSEFATGENANFFRVSIYQSLRARGPEPNLEELGEAVDYCTELIESKGDCRVGRGEFRQAELWPSTLPLGRDLAGKGRKYPTDNTADMVPLVGTQCGSPTGIPFAFAEPGRTVERLNPFDEEHPNHTMIIAGRSGSGKTLLANCILSRCLAVGARAFVMDRAGHYEVLTSLVPGAQQIELGADDSPYALNPWDVPDPAKVSREKLAYLLALHRVMMGGLDTRQVGLLGAAIRAVYAKAAALPGSPTPRESLLQDELRAEAAEAQAQDAFDVAATLRNLADRLAEYCGEGTYAHLLDRDTTVPADSRLVVFDTRRCPESELQLVMFQIMEYVTSTVQSHWETHKQAAGEPGAPLFAGRSIIHMDEAWHMISRPETGAYASDLARRVRHWGAMLSAMSQQLSDFNTEHGQALIENSSQQLLLAQNPKAIEFTADALKLTEREASDLTRLKTVKGRQSQLLWLNGSRGHGKVALRVGPKEYWAFTSERTEQAMRDAEVARQGGNVWQAIAELASRGTRAHRDRPPVDPVGRGGGSAVDEPVTASR
jgi:TraG P-loop domain